MGTNFYLECRSCGHRVHIAKRSMGWMPSFEAWPYTDNWMNGPDGWHDEDTFSRPTIRCVDDIRKACATGKWDIVSEYGDELTWDDFVRDVVEWKGGGNSRPRSHLRPYDDAEYATCLVKPDSDGNQMCYYEFR